MASLEKIEWGLKYLYETLGGRISDLERSLDRTQRELGALILLLSKKGIEFDWDEWEAAGKELDAARQVDSALDPRVQKGDELFQRLMDGEAVEDEVNKWLRDVREGDSAAPPKDEMDDDEEEPKP